MTENEELTLAHKQYLEKKIEQLEQKIQKEKQKLRDMVIFILGVCLGILGNLFASNYLAYTYPNGIPQDQALIGAIVWGFFIAFYMYLVIRYIEKG